MSYFGNGDAIAETLDPVTSLGHTLMMEMCFTNLAISSSPSETKSQCRDRKTGLLVTKRKGISEVVHTVTITATHYDWQSLGFFHDELPQDVAASINVNKDVTIPSPLTAPFVVTDPEITATNEPTVRVYVSEKGIWGDARALKCVTTPPVDGTEFQIDGATGQLTFHQDLAGARILYKLDRPYTAIQSIGAAQVWESFGNIQMWFKAFGKDDFAQGNLFHIPEMIRTSAPPQIDFSQSPATITVTFEANGKDGRAFPYRVYNEEYATV